MSIFWYRWDQYTINADFMHKIETETVLCLHTVNWSTGVKFGGALENVKLRKIKIGVS